MDQATRVLFLKQTATKRNYFVELGTDIANQIGPCSMFTSVPDCQEGNLRIISGPEYRRDSGISRISTWTYYFIKALGVASRTDRRALLFIVAQPPFLPLIGYLRSLLFSQQYVVWVEDLYPDALVRHGRASEKGLIVKLWGWLNRRMFGRASQVFTLGPCMAEHLKRYMPNTADSGTDVKVIPTWVDSSDFSDSPKEQNPFAVQHDQVGKLTVLYSGNMGLSHDFDTIIEGARRLYEYRDIHFMLVGGGPRWNQVQDLATELDNVTVLPYQPEETLSCFLSAGEVAIVTLAKGFEGISMPSKTYYNMAAGSAILGISHPPNDLQMVISEYECGLNVEPGDVQGFVDAVIRFREDKAFLERCRQNGRLAAQTTFSRKANVEKVLKAISPMVSVRNSEL